MNRYRSCMRATIPPPPTHSDDCAKLACDAVVACSVLLHGGECATLGGGEDDACGVQQPHACGEEPFACNDPLCLVCYHFRDLSQVNPKLSHTDGFLTNVNCLSHGSLASM